MMIYMRGDKVHNVSSVKDVKLDNCLILIHVDVTKSQLQMPRTGPVKPYILQQMYIEYCMEILNTVYLYDILSIYSGLISKMSNFYHK